MNVVPPNSATAVIYKLCAVSKWVSFKTTLPHVGMVIKCMFEVNVTVTEMAMCQ